MRKSIGFLLAASLLASFPVPVAAQTYGQQASPGAELLGRCVIGKTTGDDRLLVARWIGSGLASSPQLEGVVTVNAAAKVELDRGMAQLFVRLFTVDCVEEARPLIVDGDTASVQVAFGMLGEVAMGDLMRDPRALAALTSYVALIPADTFDIFKP